MKASNRWFSGRKGIQAKLLTDEENMQNYPYPVVYSSANLDRREKFYYFYLKNTGTISSWGGFFLSLQTGYLYPT